MRNRKFFAFLLALLLIPAAAWAHCSGTQLTIDGDIMAYDESSNEPIVRVAPGGSFEATILVEGTTIWATIDADTWDDKDPGIEAGAPISFQLVGGHNGGGSDHSAPWFTWRFTALSTAAVSGKYHVDLYATNRGASDHETAHTAFYVYIDSPNDKTAEIIKGDGQTLKVALGGKATATFEGNQYTRSWDFDETSLPDWVVSHSVSIKSMGSAAQGQLILTAKQGSAATVGATGQIKVYARNGVGQRSSAATVNLVAVNPGTAVPAIDKDCQNMTAYGIQGSVASVTLFGQNITHWDWAAYASQGVRRVELDYSANPNRCKVALTISEDAKPTENEKAVTLYAYGKYGDVTSTDLSLEIIDKELFEDPKIIESPESVDVIQGGTVVASYRGEHVNHWNIAGENLPAGLSGIVMRYDSDPNTCDMVITASTLATLNSTITVPVEAYNGVGEKVEKNLLVNIVPTDAQKTPVINCGQTLGVIPGGTASAVFTGKNIQEWRYKSLPTDLKEMTMAYEANPNHCTVTVTASNNATIGDSFEVPVYAYNGIGTETFETLKVTILSDPAHEAPVIDGNQSVSVVRGGTATATFTGKNTRSWRYKKLPSALTGIDLQFANPSRCDVSIRASSNKNATGSFQVPIYAYNGVGKETSAMLNVTIVNDADHADPVINAPQPLSMLADGTGSVAVTGSNIRTWGHGALPSGLESINLKTSATDSNRCYVTVKAHWSAVEGSTFQVPIYAYNGAGEGTSKTLTVEIAKNLPEPEDPPTIDEDTAEYGVDLNHVAAIVGTKGGPGTARFTGSDNIYDWAHGPLPSWLYGIELSYDIVAYSNVCDVTVVANEGERATAEVALAAEDYIYSADIDIYAFNKNGDWATSKMRVVWLDKDYLPTLSPDVVAVDVPAGGTVSVTFEGEYIDSWDVLSNPYTSEGVSVDIKGDPEAEVATATVEASKSATIGRYPVVIGATGYNFDLDMLVTKKAYVTVNVTSGNNKSSGGCDMGLSGIALLALAGLATRRRR